MKALVHFRCAACGGLEPTHAHVLRRWLLVLCGSCELVLRGLRVRGAGEVV